ncbi:gamma carbonic anhydrase family protein [Streptomyces sporangiiformans]|uniref:Gamma carbonic anhydrase family protein n=1 Tax=Streptomyces sporangiiformans TaxID=2315329 RepID=A0A505DGK8_9ACTN|nr:gamma carbonic anhydrase family protein [Streptomyces sporangiiformans]TPQ21950.1 gamma carbonic anhydrase family protein [Streptomyces sporangiiformans]
MLMEHRGRRPVVPASAYVAPSAVLCGAVTLGEGARVLHGAVLTAEDGEVRIGANVVVMENALVRGRARHPAIIGDAVLIGPRAHINGARIEDEVFVATGASAFPGAVAGAGSELRINCVLHVNSVLPPGTVVPIGWVAAGAPEAQLFPPDRHDELWEVQRELDFPGTVYGVPRGTPMREIMARQADYFGAHLGDQPLDEPPPTAP